MSCFLPFMKPAAELGECELPEHTPELVSEFRFIPNQTEAMEFDIFQRWKECRYLDATIQHSNVCIWSRVCIWSEGFPDSSDSKESACNVGEPGSIPGSGRSPGEGNGNLLQYSCLKNPTGQRSLNLAGYSPWGHKESDTTE